MHALSSLDTPFKCNWKWETCRQAPSEKSFDLKLTKHFSCLFCKRIRNHTKAKQNYLSLSDNFSNASLFACSCAVDYCK